MRFWPAPAFVDVLGDRGGGQHGLQLADEGGLLGLELGHVGLGVGGLGVEPAVGAGARGAAVL